VDSIGLITELVQPLGDTHRAAPPSGQ